MSDNPYATPLSDLENYGDGSGIWIEKKLLVMRKKAVLPDRCYHCNADAQGNRLKQKLLWTPPLVVLSTLLFFVVPFLGELAFIAFTVLWLIAVLVFRKRHRIDYGICEKHLKQRRLLYAVAWCFLIASVVASLVSTVLHWHVGILVGTVLLLVGILFAIVTRLGRTITARKITADMVWLKGFGQEFRDVYPPLEK